MQWLWLCLTIGLFVIELATTQLVCVWFAASAMITAILTAIFGDMGFGIVWQLVVFTVL